MSDYLHLVGSRMTYIDMKRRRVDVTWLRMTKNGRVPRDGIDRAIIGKTRLVAISSTSFVNGFQHDVKRF